MRGARRLPKRNGAARFFVFLLLLAMSQDVLSFSEGDQELVRVREDSRSSPGGGGDQEQQQQQQLSRLGSKPPCCERKCAGCAPCEAVQVRAGAAEGRLRPQCANYEPVGWKCKCGAAIFDP